MRGQASVEFLTAISIIAAISVAALAVAPKNIDREIELKSAERDCELLASALAASLPGTRIYLSISHTAAVYPNYVELVDHPVFCRWKGNASGTVVRPGNLSLTNPGNFTFVTQILFENRTILAGEFLSGAEIDVLLPNGSSYPGFPKTLSGQFISEPWDPEPGTYILVARENRTGIEISQRVVV